MSRTLSSVKWKEFKVKKIFSKIEKCKCGNIGNLEDGLIPYIGATNRNNGTIRYVKAPKKLITKGNCIVFICDGQGSVGYSIYKTEDFVGSTTLKVGRNDFLNYYNAQFIVGALDKNRSIYSYGYKRTEPRLKNETIYLPVNSNGEPDYEFMEEYIKEKESKLKQEYKIYIQNRVAQLQKKIDIQNKEWKNFKLSKIFTFDKGNQNNMGSLQNGNIPLVSAKKVDNGYNDFVSKNNKKIFKGSCISLNNDGDGGAGIAYYQPYKMLLDSHCTALIPKLVLTKETLIFLSRAITKQRNKFGHGYAINKERLKIFQIMLPINSKNEPDYEFMHDYMLHLEQKKILEYLEYINEK